MCIHCSQPQGVRQLEWNVNHDLAYFPVRMLVAAARTQGMVWAHNLVASGRICMLLSLDMNPSPLASWSNHPGPSVRTSVRLGCVHVLGVIVTFMCLVRFWSTIGHKTKVYPLAAPCAHRVVIHWTTPFAGWPCPLDPVDGHGTIRTEELCNSDEREEG